MLAEIRSEFDSLRNLVMQALHRGGGGGGASATQYTFVYRPSGVTAGNVFATWPALVTARALVPGPVEIQVDASLAGTAPYAHVPAGTGALGDVVFSQHPPAIGESILVFDDGAHITATSITTNIPLLSASTSSVWSPPVGNQVSFLRVNPGGAFATVAAFGGSAPMIHALSGAALSVIGIGMQVGDNTTASLQADVGASVTVAGSFITRITQNSLSGAGAINVALTPDCQMPFPQGVATLTLTWHNETGSSFVFRPGGAHLQGPVAYSNFAQMYAALNGGTPGIQSALGKIQILLDDVSGAVTIPAGAYDFSRFDLRFKSEGQVVTLADGATLDATSTLHLSGGGALQVIAIASPSWAAPPNAMIVLDDSSSIQMDNSSTQSLLDSVNPVHFFLSPGSELLSNDTDVAVAHVSGGSTGTVLASTGAFIGPDALLGAWNVNLGNANLQSQNVANDMTVSASGSTLGDFADAGGVDFGSAAQPIVGCALGSITLSGGANAHVKGCSWGVGSTPVISGGTTVFFDGPSYRSFVAAGGSVTAPMIALVGGGYAAAAVEGANLPTGADATVALNGVGATSTLGGNHYTLAGALGANHVCQALLAGSNEGDTMRITRTDATAAFTYTIEDDLGATLVVFPASKRSFADLERKGGHWVLAAMGTI